MNPDQIAVPTQASFVEPILWNFAAQKTSVFGVAALAVVGMRQLQKRYAAPRQLLFAIAKDPAIFLVGKSDVSGRGVDQRNANAQAVEENPRHRADALQLLLLHLQSLSDPAP